MKIFRNPFFYLSLVLTIVVGFQIASIVTGTDIFNEPSTGFPGGNVQAPLYKSNTVDQNSSGEIVTSGTGGASANFGSGRITFSNGSALYALDNTQNTRYALLPLDQSNNTSLFFGSGGYLFIKDANLTTALTINSNSPAANLSADFNLDFNGSVNAKSLCFSGDCKTAWSQITGNVTMFEKVVGASCSATTDYLLAKRWESKTCLGVSGAGCSNPSSCTTAGGWSGPSDPAPRCSYQIAGYNDRGQPVCVYGICQATQSDSICIAD